MWIANEWPVSVSRSKKKQGEENASERESESERIKVRGESSCMFNLMVNLLRSFNKLVVMEGSGYSFPLFSLSLFILLFLCLPFFELSHFVTRVRLDETFFPALHEWSSWRNSRNQHHRCRWESNWRQKKTKWSESFFTKEITVHRESELYEQLCTSLIDSLEWGEVDIEAKHSSKRREWEIILLASSSVNYQLDYRWIHQYSSRKRERKCSCCFVRKMKRRFLVSLYPRKRKS